MDPVITISLFVPLVFGILSLIVSLFIPLVIGILIGLIVKKSFSIFVLGSLVVVILVITGAISITYGDFFNVALQVLPKLWAGAQGFIGVLPYSTLMFVIGLLFGLFK